MMKKIFLTIAGMLLSVGVFAQNDNPVKKATPEAEKQVKSNRHPNGYMIKDGRMMQVKDGNLMLIEKDITLSNGTIIMADGNYMEKGKSKAMLKEGERVDMNGNITKSKQ